MSLSSISPVIIQRAATKIQARVRGQQLRNKQLLEAASKVALHWAAKAGKTEVVEELVKAGADVNVKNKYGLTALQMAKYYDCYDDVKNAIEEGKNELIKLHQDKLNKYQKKQDQLPGYIKFVLKQSLQGTSAVTRTIVQFIEKPLSKSQKEQAKKYIEEREAAAATKIQAMARGNLVRIRNKSLNQKSK